MESVRNSVELDAAYSTLSPTKKSTLKDNANLYKRSESDVKICLTPFYSYTEPDLEMEFCKAPNMSDLLVNNNSLKNIDEARGSLDFLDEKKLSKNSIKASEDSLSPQRKWISFKKSSSTNSYTMDHSKSQQADNEGHSLSPKKSLSYMTSKSFEKKGYLLKKSANIFFKWQKIYFAVQPNKIYYAPSKESFDHQVDVKCINLKTNPCRIVDYKGLDFSIAIDGIAAPLCLRGNTLSEATLWVNVLNKIFSFIEENGTPAKNYTSSPENLLKADLLTEKEFLKEVDTGDLLLFQSDHFGAKMQRLFTSSEYDHIAIIVKALDDVYIFDSVYEHGVQLTTWKEFKEKGCYLGYSTIAYRKLNVANKRLETQVKEKLWEFVTQQVGKKYELNVWKLFRRASIIDLDDEDFDKKIVPKKLTIETETHKNNGSKAATKGASPYIMPKTTPSSVYRGCNEGFFCSELVAAAYKYIGLLDSTISSSKYLPVSFSQKKDLGLLKGASLSCEYGLALINEYR